MIKDKKYKASVTIEMSYIMPLVLFIIVVLIKTTFYFHDKIILSGVAGETLVTVTQYEREKEKINSEEFLRRRTENKLLLLTLNNVSISVEKNNVKVHLKAEKGKMNLSIYQKAMMIRPEENLRKKRKWEILSQGGT